MSKGHNSPVHVELSSNGLSESCAYEHVMANSCGAKEIHRIVKDLREFFPVERVYISHRIGRVNVGEASVIIAASSPHRRECIAFVSDAIDRIKQSVPIWKKEFYGDGSVWKANSECTFPGVLS